MSDKSQVVVVGVGASRGLGAALARRFAREGHPVVLAGRTATRLEEIAAEVRAIGPAATVVPTDVTNDEQVSNLFETADENGPIDAVLHNVGNNAIIPFADLTAKKFELFWRIGCLGAFHVAKQAVPRMLARGHGSLMFTGASASLRGKPAFAHFAAAKAGLRNLAQSLAREYGPQGVHVAHVIVDGVINGEAVRNILPEYVDRLGEEGTLDPDAIAETYLAIHQQPRSAWTHETEVRPFKESW